MNAQPHPATLAPTPFVDSDHPEVVSFARQHAQGRLALRQAALCEHLPEQRLRPRLMRIGREAELAKKH